MADQGVELEAAGGENCAEGVDVWPEGPRGVEFPTIALDRFLFWGNFVAVGVKASRTPALDLRGSKGKGNIGGEPARAGSTRFPFSLPCRSQGILGMSSIVRGPIRSIPIGV